MRQVIDATRAWIEQPFRSQMDLLHWVLFVGLIASAMYLWSRVLAHIGE
jgi:hypothetical protein